MSSGAGGDEEGWGEGRILPSPQWQLMTSYGVVITTWLPNGDHLGTAMLDFWIFPKVQESAKI